MNCKNLTLGVIGIGNMGKAIIDGVIKSSIIQNTNIFTSDINKNRVDELVKKYGVKAATNKQISECDICIIAVKPNVAEKVFGEITPKDGSIILSIVTGLSIFRGETILGDHVKFIRAMPNTPLMVGEGVMAVAGGKNITETDLNIIKTIFQSLGKVFIVSEAEMDAVTGLSGSGPAYIFQIIEALSDGGVLEGLPRDKAIKMAAQTVLGAAKMVLETGLHPAALKDMVTSPGGTTIEGVLAMEQGGVRKSMIEAVKASAEKSKKMGGK